MVRCPHKNVSYEGLAGNAALRKWCKDCGALYTFALLKNGFRSKLRRWHSPRNYLK